MISSVTGSGVDAELLGPYYWIHNLISPVLFADTVKELVTPVDGDQERGRPVDWNWPPQCVGWPNRADFVYSIENVGYKFVLTLGENSLDSSLKLASELFHPGVPFEVQKVNVTRTAIC